MGQLPTVIAYSHVLKQISSVFQIVVLNKVCPLWPDPLPLSQLQMYSHCQ